MREINRLLIIRDDKLGDNCLSLSVLEALMHLSPNTRVTWACQPQWAGLVVDHPLVEEVWTIPSKPGLRDQIKLAHRIRKHQPDAMLLLRYCREWDRVIRYSGVPIRAGMKFRASSRALTHNGWDMLDRRYHEARRALDVLSVALGCEVEDYPARVHLSEMSVAASTAKLSDLSLPQSYFAVQLATGGTNREMPPAFLARVAQKVHSHTGLVPVLTGTAQESHLEPEFARYFGQGYVSAFGKTSIVELAVLLERSTFILSVDTGIVHLGAALNVPSVVLMPKLQLSPSKWGPWMIRHMLIRPMEFCEGCTLKKCRMQTSSCIDSIPEEKVVSACLQLVGTGQRVAMTM